MTDTLHALFHRTWLLCCDLCGDQTRLVWPDATVDRDSWQRFVNAWKAEHDGGHVYIDSCPSTMTGPTTIHPADATVRGCVETRPEATA